MWSASISDKPSIVTVGRVILSCFGILVGCGNFISSFKTVPIPPSLNTMNDPELAKTVK